MRKGYYVKGKFVASGSQADRELRDELRDPDVPSRSAKKRAAQRLQQLGAELIAARPERLAALPLPDELEAAIRDARNITSFGARRRQTLLVGKLMRGLDDETVDAIIAALGGERLRSPTG